MASRICAFLVWAFVSASLTFWGLRLLARPIPVPALAVPVSLEQAVRGDVLRLFPSAPKAQAAAQPVLAGRFKVLGVIAAEETPKGGRDGGVALISVDGRPPVAVHIGHRISRHEDLVVQTISRTSVGIGPEGGDLVATLALPAMPSPAQGSLPDTERLTDQSDNPSEPQAATPDDQ